MQEAYIEDMKFQLDYLEIDFFSIHKTCILFIHTQSFTFLEQNSIRFILTQLIFSMYKYLRYVESFYLDK